MTKATPLHLAARSGVRDVVALLLAARAPVDAEDVFGRTPLANAIYFGKEPAGRALLEGGASVLNVKTDLPIPSWAGGEAGRLIASKVGAYPGKGAAPSCAADLGGASGLGHTATPDAAGTSAPDRDRERAARARTGANQGEATAGRSSTRERSGGARVQSAGRGCQVAGAVRGDEGARGALGTRQCGAASRGAAARGRRDPAHPARSVLCVDGRGEDAGR